MEVDICPRIHRLGLPPTLQIVIPLMPPVTVHVKVNVSPAQVGRGAVDCPATQPKIKYRVVEGGKDS